MALPTRISKEDHAKLDPIEQRHYSDAGSGRMKLDAVAVQEGESLWSLEDVAGLKKTVSVTRQERDRAVELAKNLEGLDPQAAREAIAKVEKMKTWTPEEKVAEQIKAREVALTEKFGTEIGAVKATSGKLRTQLERELVTNKALAAMAKHGVTGADAELLLPQIERQIRVIESADGMFAPRVVDKDGHERITSRGGSTDPMSVEELVESAKTLYPKVFPGSGATGSGAAGSKGAGGSNGNAIPSSLPPTERIKALRRAGG